MGIISITILLLERVWYSIGFERAAAWSNTVNKGKIGTNIWE